MAFLPAVAVSAEQIVIGETSLTSLLMQLGVGGIIALAAVKIALMLYKDKEKASSEYHTQVLKLTQQQVEEIMRSRAAIEKLEEAIEAHSDDFRVCMHTLATISTNLGKKDGA